MKLIVTIIALVYCTSISFAQSNFHFADTSAQWNILSASSCVGIPCLYINTFIYAAGGDTVIDNVSYQIINNVDRIFPDSYIRKDSTEKVFIRNRSTNADELLYDFNLMVGDSIYYNYNKKCRVDMIDTVMLDRPRKRMHVEFFNHRDIFIEGIGAIYTSFLSPGLNREEVDGPDENLLCFYENGNLVFKDSIYNVYASPSDTLEIHCYIDSSWVGINEEQTTSKQLIIIPHPVAHQSFIVLDKTYEHIYFKVFDITGKLIIDEKYSTTDRLPINKTNMGNGNFFFYSIEADEHRWKGKFLVE